MEQQQQQQQQQCITCVLYKRTRLTDWPKESFVMQKMAEKSVFFRTKCRQKQKCFVKKNLLNVKLMKFPSLIVPPTASFLLLFCCLIYFSLFSNFIICVNGGTLHSTPLYPDPPPPQVLGLGILPLNRWWMMFVPPTPPHPHPPYTDIKTVTLWKVMENGITFFASSSKQNMMRCDPLKVKFKFSSFNYCISYI